MMMINNVYATHVLYCKHVQVAPERVTYAVTYVQFQPHESLILITILFPSTFLQAVKFATCTNYTPACEHSLL